MEITVKRHFDIIHCFAKYKVYADDKVVGEVSNGKTVTFIIPENTKKIYISSRRYYCPRTPCEVLKDKDYEVGANRLSKIAFSFLVIFIIFLIMDTLTHINFKYYGGFLILSLILVLYARVNGLDKYIRFADHESNKSPSLRNNKLY